MKGGDDTWVGLPRAAGVKRGGSRGVSVHTSEGLPLVLCCAFLPPAPVRSKKLYMSVLNPASLLVVALKPTWYAKQQSYPGDNITRLRVDVFCGQCCWKTLMVKILLLFLWWHKLQHVTLYYFVTSYCSQLKQCKEKFGLIFSVFCCGWNVPLHQMIQLGWKKNAGFVQRREISVPLWWSVHLSFKLCFRSFFSFKSQITGMLTLEWEIVRFVGLVRTDVEK